MKLLPAALKAERHSWLRPDQFVNFSRVHPLGDNKLNVERWGFASQFAPRVIRGGRYTYR